MSIQHLYQIYSGKIALSAAMQGLLGRDKFSAGFAELQRRRPEGQGKVFLQRGRIERPGLFPAAAAEGHRWRIEIFKLNAELHPSSWNAFDSLAEAYYEKGDKQKALELYRKSLELNPENENGKKFIERIENRTEKIGRWPQGGVPLKCSLAITRNAALHLDLF